MMSVNCGSLKKNFNELTWTNRVFLPMKKSRYYVRIHAEFSMVKNLESDSIGNPWRSKRKFPKCDVSMASIQGLPILQENNHMGNCSNQTARGERYAVWHTVRQMSMTDYRPCLSMFVLPIVIMVPIPIVVSITVTTILAMITIITTITISSMCRLATVGRIICDTAGQNST
jgi:hypothetical protein